MRIGYLECFSGISGDMFLGALVEAGVSPELLKKTVEALNVGARLDVSRVMRSGISATKVDVWIGGEKDQPRDEYWQSHTFVEAKSGQKHEPGHEHRHGHEHAHPREKHEQHHSHEHQHEHGQHKHEHHHEHGRGLKEIRQIIGKAGISDSAKQRAVTMFENLGRAEAKIHNSDLESIHFHEVGSVDAIVDIVCAAVGSEALGVDEWVCSPLNVGGGTVKCAHGVLPVPAPAVVELLRDAPVFSSGIQKELVTPTGAAIVKTLTGRFGQVPSMRISGAGYGAGARDIPGQPNVLRLTIGETETATTAVTQETVTVIEANIDDLNPQVFGYVMDRLLQEGALDVFGTPVQMKKNRPGMLLTVLARSEDRQKLSKTIFVETTTLGVRIREERREVLTRRSESVQTPWGEVRLKIANLNGSVSNYAPEYEDCRRLAEQHRVPLKKVMQEAIRIYLDQQNG